MSKERKIKFTVYGVKWVDRINGNTYHSVRCVRLKDGAVVVGEYQYGYADHYKQTALEAMAKAKWLPRKYKTDPWLYERESDYPVLWHCVFGLKRECVANGVL